MSSPSQLMVFMFTDVADSTKLKQPANMGAGPYAELARKHDVLFRRIADSIAGAEVLKDVGDGFMATFATASDAVRAALRFQFVINTDTDFTPASSPIPFRVRVGVHQGEVSVLDLDIHGKPKLVGPAADMTARIQSLALPGQILISRAAFDNARQYVREHPVCADGTVCPLLYWEAHGYYRFKGIPDSQEVFEVGAQGSSPRQAPVKTEKAWYVGSPDDEAMRGWRPAIGQIIPRRTSWVLDRKVGEGGFGEVWLASHQKTRERRIFKFCFSADRLRSFKRELTLFRLLKDALGDRKDIARLFDVSLEAPPYMLESQYEAGGSLIEWAERNGGIDTIPLTERIELMAKIADAVAAAHSVGVLHKDLKPGNVLIREVHGKTEPILSDFGIGILTDREQLRARAITEVSFTQVTENDSSRTGTRIYTPPELLIGKAFTVQGDVYAMGVMLYQFAVGDLGRPLAGGWEREIGDPLLREEIAACVDGDPARRIAAAVDVAARLRGLDAKRIEQRKRLEQEAASRARARLTRFAVAVSVVLAVLLVVRSHQNKQLETLNKEITKQKNEAQNQRRIAVAINKFIEGVLQSSDPNQGGKQDMRVTDAMNNAIKRLDAGDLKDDNDLETQAEQRETISQILSGNAQSPDTYALALTQANRALDIYQGLHPNLDDPDVARSLNRVADCLQSQGKYPEALSTYQEALAMRRNLKGDSSGVVESLNNLAVCYESQGSFSDALANFQEALAICRSQSNGDGLDLADSLNGVAACFVDLHRYPDALSNFQEVLAIRQQHSLGPSPDLASSLDNVAVCLDLQGNHSEALPKFQAALEMRKSLFKGNHADVAKSLFNVATCLEEQERHSDALGLFDAALTMRKNLFQGNHPDVAESLDGMASCLNHLDRLSEALKYSKQAVAMAELVWPVGHPKRQNCEDNLATIKARLDAEPATRPAPSSSSMRASHTISAGSAISSSDRTPDR